MSPFHRIFRTSSDPLLQFGESKLTSRMPRAAGVLGLVLGVLCGGVACRATDRKPADELRLIVPKILYLRPPGDRTGPPHKRAFDIRIEGDDERGVAGGATAGGRTGPPRGRLTVDARGLEKVVRLKKRPHSKCTGDATRATCPLGPGHAGWTAPNVLTPVAAEGSSAGDAGTIRYRLTTGDGRVRTARTRVVVGEPMLELRRPAKLTGVEPGGHVSLPLAVRNTGEVTVHGIGFGMSADGLTARQRYRNCRYSKVHGSGQAVCRFPDVRVRPGETVALTPALGFTAPKRRLGSTVRWSLWPLVLGPGPDDVRVADGAAGDGTELGVDEVLGPLPAGQGTFTGARWKSTRVELDLHADFEALGATVHGTTGGERRITIGVRNNGPGELAPGHVVKLVFTVPLGSSVVKQPIRQIDVDAYEPLCRHGFDEDERDTYTCAVDAMAEGASRTLGFTLRTREPGTGLVRVREADPGAPVGADDRSSNDTADVTVSR